MDDYRYEQRRKRKGDHCIFACVSADGVERSHLCGCGSRCEPSKKHKNRIAKRALKANDHKNWRNGD